MPSRVDHALAVEARGGRTSLPARAPAGPEMAGHIRCAAGSSVPERFDRNRRRLTWDVHSRLPEERSPAHTPAAPTRRRSRLKVAVAVRARVQVHVQHALLARQLMLQGLPVILVAKSCSIRTILVLRRPTNVSTKLTGTTRLSAHIPEYRSRTGLTMCKCPSW